MSIENLTLKEIKEVVGLFGSHTTKPSSGHPYVIGANYFFRTVTMALTGRIISVDEHEITLRDAAWIADTGRFAQAVATGEFAEVEPYPDDREVVVGRAVLIDAVRIPSLPREQK